MCINIFGCEKYSCPHFSPEVDPRNVSLVPGVKHYVGTLPQQYDLINDHRIPSMVRSTGQIGVFEYAMHFGLQSR
jgi:hypothetical protein